MSHDLHVWALTAAFLASGPGSGQRLFESLKLRPGHLRLTAHMHAVLPHDSIAAALALALTLFSLQTDVGLSFHGRSPKTFTGSDTLPNTGCSNTRQAS